METGNELVATNQTVALLRAIKEQIANVPANTTPVEVTVSLSVICDVMIEMYQHGHFMEAKKRRHNFQIILAELVKMLEHKQRDVTQFMNFIEEKLDKAKVIRKEGNKQQIIWTSVNCSANGLGLAAVFIPGLNVPLIAAGVIGSVIGITGRCITKNQTKKEFDQVMKDISTNDSYHLISFSELAKKKQADYERRLNDLVNRYSLHEKQANAVVMVEMIIDCLCRMRQPIRQAEQPSSRAEISSNILSQLLNKASVLFNKYGKDVVVNLIDDVVIELTPNALKAISSSVVIVATAINIYQIYSEMNDRDQSVEEIEHLYKVLHDGKDSLQFFINKAQDLRMHFYHSSQVELEDEVKQLKISNDQSQSKIEELSEEMKRQNARFQRLIQALISGNGNRIAGLTDGSDDDDDQDNQQSIEWNQI